jgi:hypothetical protein
MMKTPGRDKLLKSLNYAGAILTFVAALGAIFATTRLSAQHPYLLPIAILIYLAGQLALILARVGETITRLSLKAVAMLVGLHALLSGWDLIALAIGLPSILLTMVLGPLMVVILSLSSLVLGLYLVERVIGYDLQGYTSLIERPFQAFLTSAVWLLSLLVLIWHFGAHESADWEMDRAGEFAIGLRQQLQERIAAVVQEQPGQGRS